MIRTSTLRLLLGLALPLALAGCNQAPVESAELEQQALADEAAPAVEAPKSPMRRGHFGSPEALFERFDKDKDGVLKLEELPTKLQRMLAGADKDSDGALSLQELGAHRDAMKAKMFSHIDSNGDGFVTEAEAGKRWSKLSVADANKDGKVSAEELGQAHRDGTLVPFHGKRGFAGKRGMMDPARMLEKFDANKDGKLELVELPERMRERLGAADTNGDKVLSLDELRAHHEARMKSADGFERPRVRSKDRATHTL